MDSQLAIAEQVLAQAGMTEPKELAENLRIRGQHRAFHPGAGGETTYAEAMSVMIYDLIIHGQAKFSDGSDITVHTLRDWMELVRFVHAQVEEDNKTGSGFTQNNFNVFKIYKGIDPDEV